MLDDVAILGNERQDYRDLGFLMLQLLELGTSLTTPAVLELKSPEKWNEPLKTFFHKTQECSGEALRQVSHNEANQKIKMLKFAGCIPRTVPW